MTLSVNNHTMKIREQCQVAPPPRSLPSTTLPLTFFDIAHFCSRPVQRIFFYEFPCSTQHFMQEALPNLKHSLSLTLQHFFPFVSNLIVPPHPHIPYIRYLDGDSLSFTVAEYEANFDNLVSDSPQDVRDWDPLVPSLPSQTVEEDGTRVIPLTAIQITVIPNSGFSVCLTINHVTADGKAIHHFFKYWASVCKSRGDLASIEGSLPLPFHDRGKVKDPKGLKLIYLQELRDLASKRLEFAGAVQDIFYERVRVTLVLTHDQVEKLKEWISIKCKTKYGSKNLHISTFVVTCALIWVCMMKSGESTDNTNNFVSKDGDELCHLVIPADCRDRPELSFPSTYFGNCVACGFVAIKRSILLGENGVVDVANAIEREVRDLKSDALKNSETLMPYYRELLKQGKSLLVISGSPKLVMYDIDFGWGRPKKSEAVHIGSSKAISLSDCRGNEGGIEVGLALERIRMNNFINILEEQLHNIVV